MSKKLFTPGPSNVSQNIRVQLAKDIIHHRMNDYHKLFYQVTKKLKAIFNTSRPVITFTSSGTGAMESSVVNLFSKGDTVLVINTGYFGNRFIELCQTYELNTLHLDYEWGTSYNLEDVKECFTHHHIKGVFITYHETSTGVLNELKELGEFIAKTDALFITDCVSGMILHPFYFDDWKVDCALAASQKGFGLPPGLSFVALSEKAVERLPHSDLPKYYFSYQKYMDYYKKGENPFTPAISLMLALDVSLDYLLDYGVENIVNDKKYLRHYVEQEFIKLGFSLFVQEESIRGNVMVPVISNHRELNLGELICYLDERYNLQVSKGQGEFSDKMLRIGIISDFTKEDIDELIERIKAFIDKKEMLEA
jgi:aspartate aminotransferase-like enzyme